MGGNKQNQTKDYPLWKHKETYKLTEIISIFSVFNNKSVSWQTFCYVHMPSELNSQIKLKLICMCYIIILVERKQYYLVTYNAQRLS